jgi:hypothetical protein
MFGHQHYKRNKSFVKQLAKKSNNYTRDENGNLLINRRNKKIKKILKALKYGELNKLELIKW